MFKLIKTTTEEIVRDAIIILKIVSRWSGMQFVYIKQQLKF
jgi:hypothetical protein